MATAPTAVADGHGLFRGYPEDRTKERHGYHAASQIADRLDSPPADWLVFKAEYRTPYIDHFAYDQDKRDMHVACGSQAPGKLAERMAGGR